MGDFWYVWVLPVVGGIIWYCLSGALVRAPGNALQKKFQQLGTISGRTYSEIVQYCGKPNAISGVSGGKTLCQWQATGYHIALLFDENNICEGISSETSV